MLHHAQERSIKQGQSSPGGRTVPDVVPAQLTIAAGGCAAGRTCRISCTELPLRPSADVIAPEAGSLAKRGCPLSTTAGCAVRGCLRPACLPPAAFVVGTLWAESAPTAEAWSRVRWLLTDAVA